MNTLIKSLVDQMHQVQSGANWIGTNAEKKVKMVSDKDFFYKPEGGHSIAEIIAHMTAWRNETILKVRTGKGLMTDDDPANWKDNSTLKLLGKKQVLKSYRMSLSELTEILNSKSDDFLDEKYYDADFKGHYPYSFVLFGMLHHDLYHLGQIGLLASMLPSKKQAAGS